jgi:hypothetical protein
MKVVEGRVDKYIADLLLRVRLWVEKCDLHDHGILISYSHAFKVAQA